MKAVYFLSLVFISTTVLVIGLFPKEVYGHRSGCHRWHSCPSDSGSYSCGDLGYSCRYPTYPEGGSYTTPKTYIYPSPSPKIKTPTPTPTVFPYYRKDGTPIGGAVVGEKTAVASDTKEPKKNSGINWWIVIGTIYLGFIIKDLIFKKKA